MSLTKRERMKLPRVEMPEQAPSLRRWNFDEVNLGLSGAMARAEAERCLLCANPPCVAGCPVDIKIDQFILKLAEGDLSGAASIIKVDNSLPAICGRVCPQEDQCEGACVLDSKERL